MQYGDEHAKGPGMSGEKSINDLQLSADGRLLITASDDGTARLYDARTLEKIPHDTEEQKVRDRCHHSPVGK